MSQITRSGRIMMISLNEPSGDNIREGMINLIYSVRHLLRDGSSTGRVVHRARQVRDCTSNEMGCAVLVSHSLDHHLVVPEDIYNLVRPFNHGVRFFGHFLGVPAFSTGSGLARTNGLILWEIDRIGGVEAAVREFYLSQVSELSELRVSMGDYYEGLLEDLGSQMAAKTGPPVYADMEDVVRSMHV